MKYLIVLCFVFNCLCSVVFASQEDVDQAQATAQSIQNMTGSAESIRDSFLNPLTSNTQMSTLNGEQFNAQVGCSSGAKFLELMAQAGSSGDLTMVTAHQDLDLDSQFDSSWNAGTHISGVCGNGFISCDRGTMNNCQSYAWSVNDRYELGVTPTPMDDLGGCYCVNNSCGNHLFNSNMDRVVADLGGGAAAALSAANPNYAITQVITNGPLISYFGQATSSCSDETVNHLANYSSTPQLIFEDASSQAQNDDVYDMIIESPAATQNQSALQQCDIRRNVTMNEINLSHIIDYNSGEGQVTPCGPECLQLVLGKVGNDYWNGQCSYFEHNVSFNVLRPDKIVSARLINAVYDDWMQVNVNGQHLWNGPYGSWTGQGHVPGRCELSTSWNQTPNTDFTSYLKRTGRVDFNVRVEVTGGGEGYAYAQIEVDSSCDLNPDHITNTCQSFEQNQHCTLISETVDGVTTVENGSATGFVPFAQMQQVIGSSCSMDVERDWFEKKRTYRCDTNETFDLEPALERQGFVEDSIQENQYSDKITDSHGNTRVTTHSLEQLTDDIPVQQCTHVCKTKKQRLADDISGLGPVQNSRTADTTWDIYYHTCSNDDVCPLEEGETLEKPCGCIDEFSEAATIMQIMRMSGGDTICTTGEEKPLEY